MKGLDVGLLGTLVGDLPPKTQAQLDREKLSYAAARAGAAGARARRDRPRRPRATRPGAATRSSAWFRGPASPHPTVREQPDDDGRLPLAHTSDQLRLVVPDGREDVSLAAAFEIGRLLALSQPAVVNALLRWRQEQFGAERAAQLAAEALAGVWQRCSERLPAPRSRPRRPRRPQLRARRGRAAGRGARAGAPARRSRPAAAVRATAISTARRRRSRLLARRASRRPRSRSASSRRSQDTPVASVDRRDPALAGRRLRGAAGGPRPGGRLARGRTC